jgi:hypothetical protein
VIVERSSQEDYPVDASCMDMTCLLSIVDGGQEHDRTTCMDTN